MYSCNHYGSTNIECIVVTIMAPPILLFFRIENNIKYLTKSTVGITSMQQSEENPAILIFNSNFL